MGVGGVVGDAAQAEEGGLVEVVVADLGDGDVETIADAFQHALDHPAFALEGAVAGQPQAYGDDADYHDASVRGGGRTASGKGPAGMEGGFSSCLLGCGPYVGTGDLGLRRFLIAALLGAVAMAVAGCGGSEVELEAPSTTVAVASPTAGGGSAIESVSTVDPEESEARLTVPAKAPVPVAVVEGVAVSGEPGAYTFSVTICSPETGCEQYADWWEVISAEGELLYRRVLLHPHVGEQPFTRSGGPVQAEPATELIVRGHMSTGGYGPAMRGSAATGFEAADLPADFARSVESALPLPEGCAG